MIREEGLFDDGILLIGHKRTGEWDSVPAMILRDIGIQDAELSYHRAVFIGEQRIGDGILFCEFPQNLHRIIADGADPDVVSFKALEILLQLNQLRFAEASPGGASMEQNKGFMLPT